MKRLSALFLAAVLLLGLLSGCGTSDEPAGDESSPAPAEQEKTAAPAGDESGSAPAPEETQAAERETTLMIYMIGSDLESEYSEATNDLDEIVHSGVDPETTRILVCAGGTAEWDLELMDPGSETLLRLTADGFEKEGSLPQQSMGDPACLAAFLNYCVEHYPSEHYALILWDHGRGPVIGYGSDTLFEEDSLTLSEMRQAMEQTPFAGELRLDWVGFDACLMASAELACVWQDYADTLISSQEIEPPFGWDYSFLASCGTLSPADLGCLIVDSYLNYAEEYFEKHPFFREDVTLSVLDLSHAGELEAAIGALFQAAANDVSPGYARLALARVNSRGLGRRGPNSEFDLVDLQSMTENLAEAYPEECAALTAALEKTVVFSASTAPHCCGISLYYPFYNQNYYQSSWKSIYRDLAVFPEYLRYLERYEQIWLGTDMQRFFADTLELQNGALPSTYTLELTPEQAGVYASASYYILSRYAEGLYDLIYSSADVTMEDGILTANFGGNILYFSSDYTQPRVTVTRMLDTVDGVTSYSAPSILLSRRSPLDNGDEYLSAEIRFSVDERSGEVRIKGIYSKEEGPLASGKQEPIDPSDWDMIRFVNLTPRFLVRDEQGIISPFWDWPEPSFSTWSEIPVADHPHLSFEPLYDDGKEYYILINIMDVQGNVSCSELFPLRLPPAPEQQEEKPADTVVWNGGDSVTLLDVDGVTLSLLGALDLNSGEPLYYLSCTNHTDEKIIVSLGDEEYLINGEYQNSMSLGYLTPEPGETERAALPDLAKGVALSSQGRLCSLECPYKIRRGQDYSTIARGRLRLTVPTELYLGIRWEPYLGARAEEQLLLDAEGLSVTLLGLGKPLGSDPLVALRVENQSGAQRELLIEGLQFNGVSLEPFSQPWTPSFSGLTLEDGQLSFPCLSLIDNSSLSLFSAFDYWEEEPNALPHMSSISSAALLLRVDGTLYSCPIRLAEHGEQEPLAAEGSLLYQDETLEVRLLLHTQLSELEVLEDCWYLCIVNRSDRFLIPMIDYSEAPMPVVSWPEGWNKVLPPGGRCFCTYLESTTDDQRHSLTICSGDYRTQLIALPLD